MKLKCKYCGSYISDTDEVCDTCGAINDDLKRTGIGVPKTIEELKIWYKEHNLPDEETTRFFIGKDYKEPRAFGIYYDEFDGNYIVYKNKDNGSRAIRYKGKDEEYAVNELYLKLKEEIQNQKGLNRNRRNSSNANAIATPLFFIHFFSIFASFLTVTFNIVAFLVLFLSLNPGIFIMLPILGSIKNEKKAKLVSNIWHIASLVLFIILLFTPGVTSVYQHRNDSYYTNNSQEVYYRYGSDWYYYDTYGWTNYYGDTSSLDKTNSSTISNYDVTDFKDSDYYEDPSFWNSIQNNSWTPSDSDGGGSWDSSSSWDSSDSWDSGGTDWSSDW